MSQWLVRGLGTGVRSTRYPDLVETTPGITPGRPVGGPRSADDAEQLTARCPTGALRVEQGQIVVELGRCIHAYRCVRSGNEPLAWAQDYEWATDSGGRAAARLGAT